MLGGKKNKFSGDILSALYECPFKDGIVAPAIEVLPVDSLSVIAFAAESHFLYDYTLPGTDHIAEVGVSRPGHFSLMQGQLCRDIFAPELPESTEAVGESAAKPNFPLYPLLLPTTPFHWY